MEEKDIDLNEVDFGEVKEVDDVGATMSAKLKAVGVHSVFELATAIPVDLAVAVNMTIDKARELIANANSLLEEKGLVQHSLISAVEIENERRELGYLATGSNSFDELLKGGLESGAITEVFGEYGSGKSQLAHTLSVIATQPNEAKKWTAGSVIYLDTEGTFRPERTREIAKARGLDDDAVMSRIFGVRANSAAYLQIFIQRRLARDIEENKVKLVIVDSITSLHRAEFPGRGMLADRQQKLNLIMLKLRNIAETYKLPVLICNQVSHSPDGMFGDPVKAIGGNIIGHGSTYRLYLRRSGANRIARMIDSPCHAYKEIQFTVTEKGVADVEEEKKKK